ncbi:MAG: hypothetical protein ACO1OO_15930 [Flavisolibacter sp.]
MSISEQKLELLRFVVDADDETTEKLVAFAQGLSTKEYKFSEQEVSFFEERMKEFFKSGESGITAEESIKRLREKLKK